jgi:hypothetical protein
MRHTKSLAIWIVASAAFLAAQADPPSRVGRLSYIDGPVSFQPAGEEEWVDAARNRPLISGDSIWVGNRARAEIHVGSAALRLGANTAFQFINLDDQTVQIRLSDGTLTVHLREMPSDQAFEIDTPNLAFTLNAPGEYRIDADPDARTTFLTVRDGEGEVNGGGQSFPVVSRQQVVVTGDEQIDYRLVAAPPSDVWDQWCSTRDSREDQSVSARYVSREIPGYEDLDQNGAWSEEPEYGAVWMPSSVSAGWAPYRDGHWAWIAPWGWTWVDDAPWGFAPYHYGRWASIRGRWGWIPGPRANRPVYAPALVAWVGGAGFATSVGWFPLGYREPYRPSYNVSPGYLGRVNYNTNNVVNITYANRSVRNGVTAVPYDSFARGRRVGDNGRRFSPAQLQTAQVISHPNIVPRRESVFGGRNRGVQPPAQAFSRRVVARTAPPATPVPFARQQAALARNPGRPLPPAEVQQMRQPVPVGSRPVRVIDRNQVRKVQPQMNQGAPGADRRNERRSSQQQQPPAQPVPPAAIERRNERPGRDRQRQPEQPPVQPTPPAPQRQPPPQVQQPPAQPVPPPAAIERRNERPGRERQRQPEQSPVQPMPRAPQQPSPKVHQPPAQPTPPAAIERRNERPDRSQQPPQAEREQRKERGKQDRPPKDKDEKKPGK